MINSIGRRSIGERIGEVGESAWTSGIGEGKKGEETYWVSDKG